MIVSLPFAPEGSEDWTIALLLLLVHFLSCFALQGINIYLRAVSRGGMKRQDWSFILHHVTGAVFPTSTRIVGAGHMTYMMCSFLGEFRMRRRLMRDYGVNLSVSSRFLIARYYSYVQLIHFR